MGLIARNPAPWSRPYEWALFTRQFVVTALPIACFFLPLPPTSLWAILYLAVGATILNFIYYFLHLQGWFPRSFRWFRLVLDIFLWTLLLHYTGGPGSLFFAGYLVEVLISAVAISAAGCLGAAAFSSAGFISLVLLDLQVLTTEQLISRMLILVLASFLSWLLIRRLEEKNRLVESKNQELSLRTNKIRHESDQHRRRLEGNNDKENSHPARLPTMAEGEKELIRRALRHTGWNRSSAARLLGIDRSTLLKKIKIYGLNSS